MVQYEWLLSSGVWEHPRWCDWQRPSFRRLLLSIGTWSGLATEDYGFDLPGRMGDVVLSSLLSTLRHRVSWEIADTDALIIPSTCDHL